MLNYMGQGALLLEHPAGGDNPFYLHGARLGAAAAGVLATLATIIASQAVISGAFSVTHQAVQLGFLPRLKTEHTSEKAAGQIYIPAVNWGLLVMVILLVLGFRQSSQPCVRLWHRRHRHDADHDRDARRVMFCVWKWNRLLAIGPIGLFLLVDGAYFASNITKIPDGGWFPLLVAAVSFTVLTTWATGRQLMRAAAAGGRAAAGGLHQVGGASVHRVRGTSVFLSDLAGRRARGAAAQSQAQPGASRARADPQREGRGRAACAAEEAARGPRRGRRLLPRGPPLRLHGGGRHSARPRRASRPAARRST